MSGALRISMNSHFSIVDFVPKNIGMRPLQYSPLCDLHRSLQSKAQLCQLNTMRTTQLLFAMSSPCMYLVSFSHTKCCNLYKFFTVHGRWASVFRYSEFYTGASAIFFTKCTKGRKDQTIRTTTKR